MTDTHYSELKIKLETEKAVLEEALQKLGTRNPANPNDWVPSKPAGEEFGADRTDNADIIELEQQNNASLNELEGRYNNVVRALGKFADGTYGMCEVSHEPIEPERLHANPAARTCKAHMQDEHTLG